jgi:imidazolonepropionase-like amidohydrolase
VAEQMARRGIFANIASSAPRQLALPRAPVAAGEPAHGLPETAGPGPALARWERARRLRELGVPVCFSTDAIYGIWEDWHDLSYLAQALVLSGGFSPMEVIEMITAVPARAIGWGDRIGTVEDGKLADLLVVEGNPAQDITALHQVRAVYKEGRLAS